MNQQDHWLTSANILQMIYILVTAIFSYLIWKATQAGAKASNAANDAAKASLELAKDLHDRQLMVEKGLAEQFRRDVYVQSLLLLESAKKLKKELTSEELSQLRLDFVIGNEQVAKYFNRNEQLLINRAKLNLELIRKEIYKNGNLHWTDSPELKERIESLYNIHKKLSELLERIPE